MMPLLFSFLFYLEMHCCVLFLSLFPVWLSDYFHLLHFVFCMPSPALSYSTSKRQRRVEACRWACLACDQQPITFISRPGHTSTRFDWLELVLAYDLIGWRFRRRLKSWDFLNFRSEQRTHNAVWQSVTSPHSKWMGSVSVEARDAAVWTYR